ncbi:c-type cytochrome [Bordetella petrii]|uniref:c-type cytochrome n=1 Tax=Bordetella petrii TaxID=94624 RepID=UPI001A97A951|nr:cytochrome c family protein [Bordetella petrii]MBO1111218.1 cytochrome c family protein [Bordetella petrii]
MNRRIAAAGCLAGAALAWAAAWAGPATDADPAAAAATPRIGDARRGQSIYDRCLACHALAYDRTGPRHCGLFGRRAGTVPGFAYSSAMKQSGIIWNEQTLDVFLKNPLAAVPGTSMGYAGIADAQERADLIAYLKQAPACPP